MKTWESTDPNNVWDYPLDWADQMTEDADTIASYEAFVSEDSEASDITIMDGIDPDTGLGGPPSFTDTTTLIWITGGTVGATYIIVNRITTASGRQYDHSRKLKVKAL